MLRAMPAETVSRRPSLGLAGVGSFLSDEPAFLPGVLAVALFVVWAYRDGGYPATTWYPGALFVLGLLAVVLAAWPGARRGTPRAVRWSLAFFAAYTAWTFVSISWAQSKGDAWDGANRTLFLLSVYALFALLPWRRTGAMALLGLYAA